MVLFNLSSVHFRLGFKKNARILLFHYKNYKMAGRSFWLIDEPLFTLYALFTLYGVHIIWSFEGSTNIGYDVKGILWSHAMQWILADSLILKSLQGFPNVCKSRPHILSLLHAASQPWLLPASSSSPTLPAPSSSVLQPFPILCNFQTPTAWNVLSCPVCLPSFLHPSSPPPFVTVLHIFSLSPLPSTIF